MRRKPRKNPTKSSVIQIDEISAMPNLSSNHRQMGRLKLRAALRDITPPVAVRYLQKKGFVSGGAESQIFDSYDEALLASGNRSWEDSQVVEAIVTATSVFNSGISSARRLPLDSPLKVLPALAALGSAPFLRVVDFGGGAGSHYSVARAVLAGAVSLDWSVVETTELVKHAQQFSTTELKFFDSIMAARKESKKIDLVFSSGALQYMPDPISSLRELLAIRAKHVYLTRIGLSDFGRSASMIQQSRLSQQGPAPLSKGIKDTRVAYPVTLVSRSQFENQIREDYFIRFLVEEERDAYRAGGKGFHMYGYFLDLKDQSNSA